MAEPNEVVCAEPLERALKLMQGALELVDAGQAPAHIGAILNDAIVHLAEHLDLPIPANN